MKPTLTNIAYGNDPRQVLDLYQAEQRPAPVVIFFHGGGFVGGDKSGAPNSLMIKDHIRSLGCAVVSANYRFIKQHPFPAPMEDGSAVIRFVWEHAEEWGIDRSRIAVAGSSAGANIALWNAVRGGSFNPPLPRISAVIASDGQITKDQAYYFRIYSGTQLQNHILDFYGIQSADDLNRPDIMAMAKETSTIDYVDANTPPVLMNYGLPFTSVPLPPDTPMNTLIHHPVHGHILKEKMDSLGLTCVFRHPDDPLRKGEIADFLRKAWG
jgi:acetyl esterase/lipase